MELVIAILIAALPYLISIIASNTMVNDNYDIALCNKKGKLQSGGKIWALLVAGSFGYDNYRHQADLCHAYQLLHANGIPDENIIVMMYDDIANNTRNPTQGRIINEPDGNNVYKGVLKDYTGKTITPTNFLNILTGNKTAMEGIGTGRVIMSGPEDNIFVNMVDHGSIGMFSFPSANLFADDFAATLIKMAMNKQFSKMVIYIEACNAGSMFDTLIPDDLDIFITSASDPHESSFACYYDAKRQTFLGDLFSVNWMYNSEHEKLAAASLNHQYEFVRTATTKSHVEEYGNLDIGAHKLAEFIGCKQTPGYKGHIGFNIAKHIPSDKDAVSNYDVPVALLKYRLNKTKTEQERLEIEWQISQLFTKRKEVDGIMSRFVGYLMKANPEKFSDIVDSRHSLNKANFTCYRQLVTEFDQKCYSILKNPYTAKHLQKLVNICSLDWNFAKEEAIRAMDFICSHSQHSIDVL